MTVSGMIGIGVGIFTLIGSATGAYIFLDDRHAHKTDHLELKRTFEQTVAGIDLRFLQNQLISLESRGLCKTPQYKKLCEHLRRQIRQQSK